MRIQTEAVTPWPSYIREFCGWLLVVLFALLLIWPGMRD